MLNKNFFKRIYNVLIFSDKVFFTQNNPNIKKSFLLLDGFMEMVKITFFSTFISFFLGLLLSIILFFVKIHKDKIINKFIFCFINSFINFFLSIPFLILVLLIIRFFLGPYFQLYSGFTSGLLCLILVLTAHSTRNLEQVFLQINPELYKTSYTLGANKIQFVRYFLLTEVRSYLILKLNSLYVSSVAYSSILAIIGVKGIGYVAYEYGLRGTYVYENFESSDLIFVSSLILFFWIQIINFLSVFISNKLDKSFINK
ncbi:ABC transporter permease subunit [Candidatus Phytoplasma oryzae]|nr:ABC transporter permease subunit [Candidatus Phytoplasma oryzae]